MAALHAAQGKGHPSLCVRMSSAVMHRSTAFVVFRSSCLSAAAAALFTPASPPLALDIMVLPRVRNLPGYKLCVQLVCVWLYGFQAIGSPQQQATPWDA